ncbi:MAG TPA: YceI family protein [Chitinophagales bacterium]|nr:YceI family protein [Chitinophagales bacterium]
MKKVFAALAIIASLSTQAQTWVVDNAHSNVKFSVTHLVISEVEGQFKTFTANVTSAKPDFTDAKIDFTILVSSINTDNEGRDKHLKSDDFFKADEFPNISFVGTSFKKVSDKKYVLEGNLTMRDVTKPVKFDVVYNGSVKDPYGNTKAGFKVTGVVDRLAYGLKWNNLAEAGPVVGKDVTFTVNLQLKKQ